MYPEELVTPMRNELTIIGFEELSTPEDVDRVMREKKGTMLLMVNSVCGCAAGNARPGVRLALQYGNLPDRFVTVFAGQDADATRQARSYMPGYPPSSPSMALFKDGKLVHLIPRHQIEGRMPEQIAGDLRTAFDNFCK